MVLDRYRPRSALHARFGEFWDLFHLVQNRCQPYNLADQHPDRLEQMKQLWFMLAGCYNGLPQDDRTPDGPSRTGRLELLIDNDVVGSARIKIQPAHFTLAGEV